jgi:DNA-directed RNA polymerase specialized sigma24 family protein
MAAVGNPVLQEDAARLIDEYGALYVRQYRFLVGEALKLVHRFNDAEDLTATIFLMGWEHVRNGKHITCEWLRVTMHNRAVDMRRRRKTKTKAERDYARVYDRLQ